MPQAIALPSLCCEEPCETPVTVAVPGAAGTAGAAGTNGTNGKNASTTLTLAFTMPVEGANVTATVADTSFMVAAQALAVQTAGTMLVSSITNITTVVLTNPENTATSAYAPNVAPGTNIPAGGRVAPSGIQGPSGALTGAAGGSLEGTYPNPTLAITTTKGDLIANNNNAVAPRNTRLAVGANGTVLHSDSAQAAGLIHRAIDMTGVNTTLTGALPIVRGGTSGATALAGFNALSPLTTRGDLITRDATNNIRLAIGAAARVVRSDGTDVLWAQLTGAEFATSAKFLGGQGILGSLIGANFNSTSDQAITISATKYIIRKIVVLNASISLTTAAGGFYTGAGKGGTILVAAAQAYSALTAAVKFLDLTLTAIVGTDTFAVTPVYLSLTTAQGAAATADVFILGDHVA